MVWTGGETGATVGIDLTSGDVDVSCSFPAAGGQGTIPQQALTLLDAGSGGRLYIYQQASASTQVGTFDIELAVRELGGGDSAAAAGTCPFNNGFVTYE